MTGYGIVERQRSTTAIARYAEKIRLRGYAVLPGGLEPSEVEHYGARLEAVLQRQMEELGESEMVKLDEALTARCLLTYDELFLKLAVHEELLALCRHLLGDYVVLMQQNGVINPPSRTHRQQAYHRDLPYQHFVSSRPLAISALFCIDPFRAETGATTVIPGSHRVETFPSDEVAAELDTAVTADPGSYIVFDSMLFHRAGTNHTARPRRAVNHVFTVPIIAQQISLPAALGGRYADDPALARLLGYDSAPAPSVVAWRERRLARRSQRSE